MSFLDEVITPNSTTSNPTQSAGSTTSIQPKNTQNSNGFLDQIIMPKDSVRAANQSNLNVQANQAQQESNQANSFGGIVKNTIMGIPKATSNLFTKTVNSGIMKMGIPPITTQLPNIIQKVPLEHLFPSTTQSLNELKIDPENLKANPKKVISDTINSFKDSINKSGDSISNIFYKPTVAGKVGAVAQSAADIGGAFFSPITALFTGANDIPVLGSFLKLVTLPFTIAGDVGKDVGKQAVQILPISKEAKSQITNGVEDLMSLAAQMIIGGKLSESTPKIRELTSNIKEKYSPADSNTIISEAMKLAKNKVEENGIHPDLHKNIQDVISTHGPDIAYQGLKDAGMTHEQAGKALDVSNKQKIAENYGKSVETPISKNITTTPALRTFDFNELEGKPQTPESNAKIHDQIVNHPESPMTPGGESFNQAAERGIGIVQKIIAKPEGNVGITTHNSMYGLIKLWDKMGRPDTLDKAFREAYTKQDNLHKTGDFHVIKDPNGNITLMRHGETKDNAKGVFRTSSTTLTEKGIQQAKDLKEQVAKHNLTKIYSSDLPRAVHTSNIVMGKIPKEGKLTIKSAEKIKGPIEIKGEDGNKNMTTPPEQLVSKTDLKGMLSGLDKKSVDMKVIEKDGKLFMEYKTPTTSVLLRPSALGLVEDNIKPGSTININTEDLKPKGPALRAFDENNMQAGFIAPGEVLKTADVKIKKYIETTVKPIKLGRDISNSFAKLEGANQADIETMFKTVQSLNTNAEDSQAIFKYGEDPNIKINDEQKKVYDEVIKPVLSIDEKLTQFIKAKGAPLPEEEPSFKEDIRGLQYMPRVPKNKTSPLQRIMDPVKGRIASAGQGGILTRSTASLKKRVYKALVDPNDHSNVKIVAEKHGQITEIKNSGKDSTILGKTKQKFAKGGKEVIGGTKGTTFIDNSGKKWEIGHATTDEITKATGQEYYQDAISTVMLRHVKLAQIARGIQFTESWKASSEFKKVAVPSEQVPPEGWKPTNNFNFRNYSFEPHMAEILDDMQRKMSSGLYNDAFTGINRTFADAIFFNGLAHPINVAVTWVYNRGISGLTPKNIQIGYKAFGKALTALSTKNEDYMTLLREGAHLMSSDINNKKVAETLAKKFNKDLQNTPPALRDKISTILGKISGQATFKKNVIYKLSHDMAWLSNDLLTMQSIYESMDRYNMTMSEAIKETARFIPEYRQKSRLLDKPLSALLGPGMGGATSRTLAKGMYNRNLSMFGSYHVGLLESLNNALGDTIGASKGFNKEANKTRTRGADKLAMLAILGLIIYPWLDEEARKITGDTKTYITRSGIMKYPYLAYKAITGQTTPTQVLTGVATPAVGTQTAIELAFNRDLFTGNKIYGIGGEGAGGFISSKIAPAAEIKKVATGQLTPGSFGATLIGVHTPKNTQIGIDLNDKIYTEKPLINTKAKQLISAGDTQGAFDVIKKYNTELKTLIKKADIAGGNSGSDARVQYFFNQYALHMPGDKAIANFEAGQGKSIVQKRLPNGKPVIVKNTPIESTGFISTVTNYAKAIGTDPITAFKDIIHGQIIRKVDNGVIIVQRMAVSDSQAQKSALAQEGEITTKGMTLDHLLPLELGGTNETSNLRLYPAAEAKADDIVENYLADQLHNGGDKSKIQSAMLDYKNRAITFDDIKKMKF